MLVEPLIGRHDDAARFPIDALWRFALRPENRVTLPAENDHMGAGAMAVPFLVSADVELRDMRAHGVLRQIELHVGAALAALTVVGELERMGVRNKVSG